MFVCIWMFLYLFVGLGFCFKWRSWSPLDCFVCLRSSNHQTQQKQQQKHNTQTNTNINNNTTHKRNKHNKHTQHTQQCTNTHAHTNNTTHNKHEHKQQTTQTQTMFVCIWLILYLLLVWDYVSTGGPGRHLLVRFCRD